MSHRSNYALLIEKRRLEMNAEKKTEVKLANVLTILQCVALKTSWLRQYGL